MDFDRDRGILGQADRRYLAGESDIEPKSQSERNVRARIRNRFRNAILDMPILLKQLEDRDLEQVLRPDILHDEVTAAIPAAIGLLYLDDEEVFETRVQQGITRAELRKGWEADVTVNIGVDRGVSVDDLAARVEDGGIDTDVSVKQLNILLETGKISPELYGKIAEKRLKQSPISEGIVIDNHLPDDE